MIPRTLPIGALVGFLSGCADSNGSGGPVPLATESPMVDLDPFAECMKAKGYTVTP